jgi:hypothetical protein
MLSPPLAPPAPVRIAATIFWVFAWFALAEVVFLLVYGRVQLEFGLLGFWIAPGLRRGDAAARKWALILAALGVVTAIVVSVLVLTGFAGDIKVFGVSRPDVPSWVVIPWFVAQAALDAWLWRALRRPESRNWFALASVPAPSMP